MQGRPVRVQRLKLGVGASRERGEPCWEQFSSARMLLVHLRGIARDFEPSFAESGGKVSQDQLVAVSEYKPNQTRVVKNPSWGFGFSQRGL